MKKKLALILIVLIILTLVSIAVVIKLTTDKYAKEIELSMNQALYEASKEEMNIAYDNFTCSGFVQIKCFNPMIKIGDDNYNVNLREINLKIKPKLKSARILGDLKYDFLDSINNKSHIDLYAEIDPDTGILGIDFLTGGTYKELINNYKGKINLQSDFYKGKTFLKLSKAYRELGEDEYVKQIGVSKIGIEKLVMSFEGKKLSEDVLKFFKDLGLSITGDDILQYSNYGVVMLSGILDNVKEAELITSLYKAGKDLEKVFADGVNYYEIELQTKEKDVLKQLIDFENLESIDSFSNLFKVSSSNTKK